jgi:hypothetical protein
MNYVLNTGCGDFLNAEGAKVSQRAQKKMEKGIPKFVKTIFAKECFKFNFDFNLNLILNFFFVFLLRSLRNLRALCVQKLPFSSPSSQRAASTL